MKGKSPIAAVVMAVVMSFCYAQTAAAKRHMNISKDAKEYVLIYQTRNEAQFPPAVKPKNNRASKGGVIHLSIDTSPVGEKMTDRHFSVVTMVTERVTPIYSRSLTLPRLGQAAFSTGTKTLLHDISAKSAQQKEFIVLQGDK